MQILTADNETIKEKKTVIEENDYLEPEGPNYFLIGGPCSRYERIRFMAKVYNE